MVRQLQFALLPNLHSIWICARPSQLAHSNSTCLTKLDSLHSNKLAQIHSTKLAQLRSNVPAQLRSNMPAQLRSNMPTQLRGNMLAQLRSNMPTQLRSNMPTQLCSNKLAQPDSNSKLAQLHSHCSSNNRPTKLKPTQSVKLALAFRPRIWTNPRSPPPHPAQQQQQQAFNQNPLAAAYRARLRAAPLQAHDGSRTAGPQQANLLVGQQPQQQYNLNSSSQNSRPSQTTQQPRSSPTIPQGQRPVERGQSSQYTHGGGYRGPAAGYGRRTTTTPTDRSCLARSLSPQGSLLQYECAQARPQFGPYSTNSATAHGTNTPNPHNTNNPGSDDMDNPGSYNTNA